MGGTPPAAVVLASCAKLTLPNHVLLDQQTCNVCGARPGDTVCIEPLEQPPCFSSLVSASTDKMPENLLPEQVSSFVGAAICGRLLTAPSAAVLVSVYGRPHTFTITNLHSTPPDTQAFIVMPDAEIRIGAMTADRQSAKPAARKCGIGDVASLDHELQVMEEAVELPLLHPEIYKRYGIKPSKGVVLYGPPGTGKSLLARVVAAHCNAALFEVSGSEAISKYVGESEAKLRSVFDAAAAAAPSVVLIDDIDALCPKRDTSTSEVEKRIVSTLLTLMDGVAAVPRVTVIATTNRLDSVDGALRRAGRFDREVELSVPNKEGRLGILKLLLGRMPHGLTEEQIAEVAALTHGFVGADLAALCKEAALCHLRRLAGGNYTAAALSAALHDRRLCVAMEDLRTALSLVRPSAMREVAVDVPHVTWADVGGLEDVKQRLLESVQWPLKHPEAFARMGIKPPCGILLYGPPGCSKTLVAQALATESGLNFIAVKGPQLVQKYVGESERAMSFAFRKARLNAPSVLFFDELDGMFGHARGEAGVSDRLMSQMLVEMDGVQPLTANVIVIAATNRPDLVDPALLRPGRFDRLLYLGPPAQGAREAILRVHLARTPVSADVDLAKVAARLEGYSGAEIAGLCRAAALLALREDVHAETVARAHFDACLEKLPSASITTDVVQFYKSFGATAT
eukprot:TRINITY_DN7310_c0_g1_i1.p1 TRINITY_DN7310_c0_g1~~TRINITY_DN7310_c0_g1_i1.p1  ORF type:complete len:785 (-),score=160.37 TRINITY_DN7310_c0_g1_i1:79-2130(-)